MSAVLGRPVQIYHFLGTKRKLDVEALAGILQDVNDIPIALVSVNGIKRSGKSYLLNFFLKYLQADVKEGWCRAVSQEHDGFIWKGGAKRITAGIWVWSEPFYVETSDHGRIAVLLMDTQGSFDGHTSFQDNALIFAISIWLSSTFIYNVRDDLAEDKLQFLEYFTDFSSSLQEPEKATEQLFQSLLFLIRDWAWPEDYDYGLHVVGSPSERNYTDDFCGGRQECEEAVVTRAEITKKFHKILSFLLPYPGLTVAQNASGINPPLSEIKENFLQSMEKLVPIVFYQILEPKSIYGEVQTGRGVINLVRRWAHLLESGEIPDVKDITRATAEAHLEMSLNRSQKEFHKKALELASLGLSDAEFNQLVRDVGIQVLESFKKCCSRHKNYAASYVSQLEKYFEDSKMAYLPYNSTVRNSKEQKVKMERMEQRAKGMENQIQNQQRQATELETQLKQQIFQSETERREMEATLGDLRNQMEALQKQKDDIYRQQQETMAQLARTSNPKTPKRAWETIIAQLAPTAFPVIPERSFRHSREKCVIS